MKTSYSFVCMLVLAMFIYNGIFAQANQSLSNLTTTSVNKDLIPATDGTTDFGNKNFNWKNLYLKTGIYLKSKLSLQAPGTGNFFVGSNAGNAALTGTYNAIFGSLSFSKPSTASFNSVVGDSALYNDSTGNNNCAFGFKSMYLDYAGSYNTAVGYSSQYRNTYGNANSSLGMFSLYNCTGSYNTALGYSALGANTSGLYNSAVGMSSLPTTTTGIGNSALGYGTDVTASNISNATVIGYNAVCDASNKVRVGNTNVTSIGGQVGWTTFSDGRYKKNIQENVQGLAFINKLRPVTYNVDINSLNNYYGKTNEHSSNNADKIIYTGFIAQEVEAAAEKLNYTFSGVDKPSSANGLYGLRYDNFVVPLVKAVQELSKMNDDKDAKLANFQNQINAQQKQIDDLKAMIENIAKNNPAFSKTNTNNSAAFLEQNAPNPFSKNTVINYTLPQKFTNAQIIIIDKTGKTMQQINVSGTGKGSVNLSAASLSAGVYSYSFLIDGKITDTKQMVITQ